MNERVVRTSTTSSVNPPPPPPKKHLHIHTHNSLSRKFSQWNIFKYLMMMIHTHTQIDSLNKTNDKKIRYFVTKRKKKKNYGLTRIGRLYKMPPPKQNKNLVVCVWWCFGLYICSRHKLQPNLWGVCVYIYVCFYFLWLSVCRVRVRIFFLHRVFILLHFHIHSYIWTRVRAKLFAINFGTTTTVL